MKKYLLIALASLATAQGAFANYVTPRNHQFYGPNGQYEGYAQDYGNGNVQMYGGDGSYQGYVQSY